MYVDTVCRGCTWSAHIHGIQPFDVDEQPTNMQVMVASMILPSCSAKSAPMVTACIAQAVQKHDTAQAVQKHDTAQAVQKHDMTALETCTDTLQTKHPSCYK
jgi:hypothetical protein